MLSKAFITLCTLALIPAASLASTLQSYVIQLRDLTTAEQTEIEKLPASTDKVKRNQEIRLEHYTELKELINAKFSSVQYDEFPEGADEQPLLPGKKSKVLVNANLRSGVIFLSTVDLRLVGYISRQADLVKSVQLNNPQFD